jgi:hypothetical protein
MLREDRTDHNRLAEQTNGRLAMGGNNPPGPLDFAKEAIAELSGYVQDNPVVATFDEAKIAAAWVERTRISLVAARDERDTKTAPLTEQVKAIRAEYEIVREKTDKNPGGVLTRLYETVKARLSAYNNAVEAARLREAQRLREEAERQEREAREAEAREQEAILNAEQGELTDVGGAILDADQAFKGFQKADRAAATAERNVPVRIASVMGGKSLSMRTTEVFIVEDACAAITIMGLSEDTRKQIIKDAKRFREATGELPDGVKSTYERSL